VLVLLHSVYNINVSSYSEFQRDIGLTHIETLIPKCVIEIHHFKWLCGLLGGSPCHHGMARPRVADGRDGFQLEVSCEYIE
jgi:hypothetical protein